MFPGMTRGSRVEFMEVNETCNRRKHTSYRQAMDEAEGRKTERQIQLLKCLGRFSPFPLIQNDLWKREDDCVYPDSSEMMTIHSGDRTF